MKPRHCLAGVVLGIAVCAVLLPGSGPFASACRAGDTLIDPAKPAEKRFAFSMEAKPWNQVFIWLSDSTNQPVVAVAVPPGTFSFVSPKDRTYTLGELVDVINDGLQPSRFFLIQRPRSWLVVPADQRLGSSLILQVRLDELPARGKTEMVRIVLPLEGAETQDALNAVKSMLGPLGQAVALGKSLVITDSVGNLLQITRVLREAGVVKPSAKAAPAMKLAVVRLTSLDALQTVRLLRGLYPSGRSSSLAFEADAANNAVVVRGAQEQVEEILATIKALGDTGTPTSGPRIITLESGSAATLAEELSKVLKQMRKNPVEVIVPGKPPTQSKPSGKDGLPSRGEASKPVPPVRLIVMGGRLMVASDDPQALLVVQQLVRLYTDPTAGEWKVIRLKYRSAMSMAPVLDQVFSDRAGQARPVRVVADPGSNTLLVKAAPLDLLMIEKLIAQTLDVETSREESVQQIYLLPLRHIQAADAARVMRDLYPAKTITVGVEPRTNSLMCRCPEAMLPDLKKIVDLLDVSPRK